MALENLASVHHEDSKSRELLGRIANGWGARAQVKRSELPLDYDPSRPDFIERLLPFVDHPSYQRLDQEQKSKILSCGWLAYNEKTVAIETAIVTPACMDILEERIPGLRDETTKQVICETLVDEAYHLLLVKNANRVTRSCRNLEAVNIPMFNLVKYMEMEKAKHAEGWKKMLVQLATTVVSEIFVSDYLDLLSDDHQIQPLNRETVAAHRHDELAHSKIFKSITECFYPALTSQQKAFFADVLPKPVLWFADLELDLWHGILAQLGIPKADEIIADSWELNKAAVERLNYSGVVRLAEDIGLLSSPEGKASFNKFGLN